MDIRRLRSRILGSMGIPAVMLASSCADPAEERRPGASPDAEPSALPVGGDEPVDEPADEQPEQPEPPPFLVELSTFEVQRVTTVTVTGAAPDAELWVVWSPMHGQSCSPMLHGGCVDLGAPELLAQGITDEQGAFEAQVLLPAAWAPQDGSPFLVQAATVDADGVPGVSELLEGTFDAPARQCFPVDELHPDFTVADLWDQSGWLVCEPRADDGSCEAAASLDQWRTIELFSDALGEALPPNWAVSALCDETTTDDCCWAMLADDTSVGNGGGGGGGWEAGRPFAVEQQARHAESATHTGWSEVVALQVGHLPPALRAQAAARWAELGASEHASVASFSRFNLELLALGAPASLLERATDAIRDEIAHARLAYAVASAYAGQPVGPGPLPVHGALDRSEDPARVLVAAILEGCINETISAALAQHAAQRAADPALAAPMRQVAEDETRHAELSWAFVRWLLAERPELRTLAAATFDGYRLPAAGSEPDLAAHGLPSGQSQHLVARRIFHEVVRPCADALLGREREVMA
jgi:hypothetical protein